MPVYSCKEVIDRGAIRAAHGYWLENQGYNGDLEAIQVIGRAPVTAAGPRARGGNAGALKLRIGGRQYEHAQSGTH
jgi:hypothetical protein